MEFRSPLRRLRYRSLRRGNPIASACRITSPVGQSFHIAFVKTSPFISSDSETDTLTGYRANRLYLRRFATIVHPHAFVSPQSTVGQGSVVLAGTTVGAFVSIGDHVIILQNVGLSHDDVIEDYSCLAVGVSFSGSVRVGRNCFLGTNSTIIGATVGEGSMVGAGALIRHDVPAGEVWVGNPGRLLRKV